MFSSAYEIARKFTQPRIIAFRFYDGTVESGLGSFVVINDEGWIVTAAHNLEVSFAYTQHQKELKEYEEKIEKINQNNSLKASQKASMIKKLKPNGKWITDFMIWFGCDGVGTQESYIYGENDVAFIRIDKNHLQGFSDLPKFRNPKDFKPGTSLCKLGFPFCPVNATFNLQSKQFEFPPTLLPVPMFPIEGIYTRNLNGGKTKDGKLDIEYLETSSPGLKGQSGGPIFDQQGAVLAIQSKNVTIPLGFKGEVEVNKKKIEENQFINVGIGVHGKTLTDLMKLHKIPYQVV